MMQKITRTALRKMTALGLAKLANEELLLEDAKCWHDLGDPLSKTALINNIMDEIKKTK